MMPGGVTCSLDESKLAECDAAIDEYAAWYERSVLGCTCEEWLALETPRTSRPGWRCPRTATAPRRVHDVRPRRSVWRSSARHAAPAEHRLLLRPRALAAAVRRAAVPSSRRLLRRRPRRRSSRSGTSRWPSTCAIAGSPIPARRAIRGRARRFRRTRASEAYSYAKATRYDDHVVQLGPLADLVLAGDPLIALAVRAQGPSTWLRQFTRLHRPVATLQAMRETVSELRAHLDEPTFIAVASRARTATGSARSTPRAAASATGSGSETARSPTTRSSRPPRGTARRATTRAGAGTGRRASSASRSRISTTRSSSFTSCARTTRAWSAPSTSPAARGAPRSVHVA